MFSHMFDVRAGQRYLDDGQGFEDHCGGDSSCSIVSLSDFSFLAGDRCGLGAHVDFVKRLENGNLGLKGIQGYSHVLFY